MTEEPKVVSWSQPICDACWLQRHPSLGTLANPGRVPVRATEPDREQCADCGMPTTSGIYVREDPHYVRYPKRILDKDWKSDEVQANRDWTVVHEATPAADL